jgi:hypothetical protein
MTHEELILSALPSASANGWTSTGQIQARIYQSGYERLSRHNLAMALRGLVRAGRVEKRRTGRYSEYRVIPL